MSPESILTAFRVVALVALQSMAEGNGEARWTRQGMEGLQWLVRVDVD